MFCSDWKWSEECRLRDWDDSKYFAKVSWYYQYHIRMPLWIFWSKSWSSIESEQNHGLTRCDVLGIVILEKHLPFVGFWYNIYLKDFEYDMLWEFLMELSMSHSEEQTFAAMELDEKSMSWTNRLSWIFSVSFASFTRIQSSPIFPLENLLIFWHSEKF
jgi:hypothetical protein